VCTSKCTSACGSSLRWGHCSYSYTYSYTRIFQTCGATAGCGLKGENRRRGSASAGQQGSSATRCGGGGIPASPGACARCFRTLYTQNRNQGWFRPHRVGPCSESQYSALTKTGSERKKKMPPLGCFGGVVWSGGSVSFGEYQSGSKAAAPWHAAAALGEGGSKVAPQRVPRG